MEKTLLLVFVLCSFLGYSQTTGNNEIKINFLYLPQGTAEICYERIINESSGAGISSAVYFGQWGPQKTLFIITPFYRIYFGKEKANGFFIEANSALGGQNGYAINSSTTKSIENTVNMGFGAALGAKFLHKKKYIVDMYGGIGHFFGIDSGHGFKDTYPRFGISIGKRL